MILVEDFLQIVGMGYIVVKFLYPIKTENIGSSFPENKTDKD